jgi:hypothetical protein
LDRPAERIEHEAEHFQSDDAQKRFIAPLTKNHRSVPVPCGSAMWHSETLRSIRVPSASAKVTRRRPGYASSTSALIATVPSGVTAHSSQRPLPAGRPRSSNGALSKSGARAWVV